MIQIIKMNVSRDDYSIRNTANESITVGELIDALRDYDSDAKIVFSNDRGYTYGIVSADCIEEEWIESREEEEKREKMEELSEELCNLQSEYENPDYEDEEKISDEQYRKMRADLFNEFGVTEEEFNNFRW